MSHTKKDADASADREATGLTRIDALLRERPFPLGVLGACIAHDISSPLTYIRWDVDALTRLVDTLRRVGESLTGAEQWATACAADPKLERMLVEYSTMVEHIRGGLDRLQTLSNDLATLARDDSPPVAYDVRDTVACGMRLIRPYVARRLIVEVQAGETPLLVHGSPADIALAVMNIGINAAQAQRESPGQGRLDVTVCEHGDEVLLRFADSGLGIAISPASRVFEPFIAGDARRCGLGLTFVREVVAAQGGHASVESGASGATVTLRLPRYQT